MKTKARIVRVDALNFAVQELTEIETVTTDPDGKRTKTGDVRQEWKDAGYYGHRLDYAVESALSKGFDIGEPITAESIRAACKAIVDETKAVLVAEKVQP